MGGLISTRLQGQVNRGKFTESESNQGSEFVLLTVVAVEQSK